jgi:hypothetical protein
MIIFEGVLFGKAFIFFCILDIKINQVLLLLNYLSIKSIVRDINYFKDEIKIIDQIFCSGDQ